ncbi:unnamed protein product [Microthlaspi erraticum]|uniref:Retrotransposon gag domain-containing protein n=1 Tax=Microthlaspi erraticum TaxID=1685480 RepID=A0A6D2K4V9_9BRAS|nr:unnamed protein product [Microthlaspi erraticum]
MSLADKAHQWEKSLPHGTITTWDECKKAFLAKFFSTGRTAKLRGEISSFIQRNNETFAEAWERYREMLDTASNGNFLNQDVDDGWQLVENMAISTECYGEHYESTDWSSTAHSKLDKLILAQFPAKHVNYVSEQTLVKGPGRGGDNTRAPWPHQQQSVPQGFNPRTTHTQPTQDWDMKEMLQQLLQGQAKGSLEMNNKLVEIHSKLESLTSRVQIIESSSASSSSPQEYAQAVTLRSGRQFPSRGSPPQIAVDIDDEEGEDLVEMLITRPELDRAGTKP